MAGMVVVNELVAAGVVRRVNVNALHPAPELRQQRPQRLIIFAMHQPSVQGLVQMVEESHDRHLQVGEVPRVHRQIPVTVVQACAHQIALRPHLLRHKLLPHHAQLAPFPHLRRHTWVGQQPLHDLHPPLLLGDAVQREHVVAFQYELGLVPDAHQLVLELGDEINHLVGGLLEHLKLPDTLPRPGRPPLLLRLEDVLVQPQVELLAEESAGVLVDEEVNLALTLEEAEGPLQGRRGGHRAGVLR